MTTFLLWLCSQNYLWKHKAAALKIILFTKKNSIILLGENIKKSYIKRNWGINICNLFITDQIKKGGLNVEYCPTAEMIAFFMRKPLQRKIFQKYRVLIMSHWMFPYYVWQQKCVGRYPTWKILQKWETYYTQETYY